MRRLPSRQVHLDFHTSGDIPAVGSKFDKTAFQDALKAGHVNSITIFAKCHHGYCYFPTKVGTQHPTMDPQQDLVQQMMDAAHEIGVYAPVYLTLGWSVLDAQEHPEWIARKKDGSFYGHHYDVNADQDAVKPESSWLHLCSAGGYRAYLYELTEEVCKRYQDLDGLFFDIVYLYDECYCDSCRRGMAQLGLNPEEAQDARAYYEMQKRVTVEGLTAILNRYHPNASIFFNSGGAELHKPQWHDINTHFELEDLPTTWGGYDKMPIRAKYFMRSGKDYLGMTGKFHRSWGEFGGYKTPGALKYECASLLSNGARISIGDQMHPLGYLDMETYKNIGEAYSYVEKIEAYCFDVKETSELGVMINRNQEINEAVSTLLLDCHVDFDVIHSEKDLENFKTVLLPDGYTLTDSYAKAIDAFLARGGRLLMLGGSGLNEEKTAFAFHCPFTYDGKSEYDKDFFEVTEAISRDMVTAPILCYESAYRVSGEGKILSYIREPYFSRTYRHYCSHYNTPYVSERASYCGAIQNGNLIYIAHPLATMYKEYGSVYHRTYFKNILELLFKNKVQAELPVQGRLHLTRQEEKKRYILHLLYASPVQRGGVSVIEDLPELDQIPVTVEVDHPIRQAYLVPQNEPLAFRQSGNQASFTVPKLSCHQIVALEYDEA